MHIVEWKRPIWNGYVLYDSTFVAFILHSGKDKMMETAERPVVARSRGGKDDQEEQRIYRAVKTFCMIPQWYMPLTFVQTPRLYTPRVTLNVKYGLRVRMTWLCSSSVVTNVPFWWRKLCTCGGRYGKSPDFSILLWAHNCSKK